MGAVGGDGVALAPSSFSPFVRTAIIAMLIDIGGEGLAVGSVRLSVFGVIGGAASAIAAVFAFCADCCDDCKKNEKADGRSKNDRKSVRFNTEPQVLGDRPGTADDDIELPIRQHENPMRSTRPGKPSAGVQVKQGEQDDTSALLSIRRGLAASAGQEKQHQRRRMQRPSTKRKEYQSQTSADPRR